MTDNAPIDTQLPKDTPSSNLAPSPVSALINQSASPSTQPASLSPAQAPSTDIKSPSESQAKTKPKRKGKKTKARPRRRVADSESEQEDGGASDGSLTDPSSASDSDPESDEEEEEGDKNEEEPQTNDQRKKSPVDTDKGGSPSKVVASGKGKGKVGPNGVKREYTEEENKRYEEMKARRKEKQKAKRAELKETKRKEQELAKSSSTDAKGKNKEVQADEENTVPLAADGSPPSSLPPVLPNQKGRRGSKSQRRQSVVNDDPKVVPRQGKFWTHDQRSDPQAQPQEGFPGPGGRGLPDWRGRGGFRGGFRGRGGRGFANHPSAPFGRFLQQNGTAQGQELTAETPVESEKEDGDEPVLAMDRLEKELAKKEKSQSASTTVPTQPKEKKWGHEAFEQIQTEKERKPVVSPAVVPGGGFRGVPVPRGRGRGFGARGGHFGQPFRQPLSSLPFHPANLAANAAAAAKSASSTSVTPAPATVPAASSTSASTVRTEPLAPPPKAEQHSTRPDADDLLGESSQAVTIKLPGSSNTVEVSVSQPSEQKSAPAQVAAESTTVLVKTPELNASGQAILYTSPVPPPQPVATQQPQPSAPVPPNSMYPNVSAPSPFQPGSENGSMSSAGMSHSQFIPTHAYPQKSHLQQNVVPTSSGYGMGSEFVPSSRPPQVHLNGNNGQSRPFYPSGAVPRSYPAQNQNQSQRPPIQPFYPSQPQSFEYAQTHSQRGSFSGSQQFYPTQQVHVNGYIDGRGSPYNGGSLSPYPTGNGQINYFAPARPSQKIQIKSPSTSTGKGNDEGGNNAGQPTFASLTTTTSSSHTDMENMMQGGYHPQHYNPYQTQAANGYDERYYGLQQQQPGYENWQNGQQQGYTGYEGEYGY